MADSSHSALFAGLEMGDIKVKNSRGTFDLEPPIRFNSDLFSCTTMTFKEDKLTLARIRFFCWLWKR